MGFAGYFISSAPCIFLSKHGKAPYQQPHPKIYVQGKSSVQPPGVGEVGMEAGGGGGAYVGTRPIFGYR